MMRLKYLLVLVTLTSWFLAEVLFVDGFLMFAFGIVAAGYAAAVLLMALSALAQKMGKDEPEIGLGMKFLLSGPPTLAGAISVSILIYLMNYRGYYVFCEVGEHCLTVRTIFQVFGPFAFNLIAITVPFYAIIWVSALFVRLFKRVP